MTTFAYFSSGYDWLIVGAFVLLLFGGTKIPQFAKGLGEGIREFKKSINGEEDEVKKSEPVEEKKDKE